MKTLVVYRSHYGSTRRYAQWLAQALDADAAEERQADARLVQNYECVIFGGGLYAGSIAGAARMVKLYGALQGKRLAMFTVGLSDPSDPENVKKIMQDAARAFTPEMLESIEGADEEGMSPSIAGFSMTKEGIPNIIFGVSEGRLAVKGINY